MTQTVERRPLHRQARALLVGLIVRGELAPGERVNETLVSRSLGVSRTPLRQALAGLERDGFVETRPGLGFFVTGVSPEEARQIYELLAELEPMALRRTTVRRERLDGLRALNTSLAESEELEEAVERNLAWHQRLLEECENAKLAELLVGLREQARRYEYLFFAPGPTSVRASVALHDRIVVALERGDREDAAEVLRAHWLTDLDRVAGAGRAAVPARHTDPDSSPLPSSALEGFS